MKKRIIYLIFGLWCSLAVQAQVSVREVFVTMPDSIFPMLTKNNRLDMPDFIDAKMRAEVSNLLGGDSEMLSLSKDSLTLRTSEAQTVLMYLLPTEAAYDSAHQVVCLERTFYLATDSISETVREFYSLKWRRLISLAPNDEKQLPPLKASGILKRDDLLLDYY